MKRLPPAKSLSISKHVLRQDALSRRLAKSRRFDPSCQKGGLVGASALCTFTKRLDASRLKDAMKGYCPETCCKGAAQGSGTSRTGRRFRIQL